MNTKKKGQGSPKKVRKLAKGTDCPPKIAHRGTQHCPSRKWKLNPVRYHYTPITRGTVELATSRRWRGQITGSVLVGM